MLNLRHLTRLGIHYPALISVLVHKANIKNTVNTLIPIIMEDSVSTMEVSRLLAVSVMIVMMDLQVSTQELLVKAVLVKMDR